MRRLCFRLAVVLGKDVREILAWPSPLLSEWMAYDQLEPLPDPWYQAGLICSMMANLWSKGARHNPEDFIPRLKIPRKRQSMQEQRTIILNAVAVAEARRKAGG